ncbi:hypothetical protein SAMN05444161_7292 [Rhizobiales bacterium GAS191]|jgi:hypothetical protein|nr:hypothetical protein SAMN05519103_06643 [Rhizobiales bacterium GAS113]SEE81827.1 hypothetical protein SAMN05444161_7292 [Rhizobiales bacterium GAS191]
MTMDRIGRVLVALAALLCGLGLVFAQNAPVSPPFEGHRHLARSLPDIVPSLARGRMPLAS